ncbi:MAG TPA: hypothetical protein VJT15_02660 [Pyrinomonadaceae bacterium]|nr:hypothetical protein [Pyrinomonadaceae bacterium]
MNHYIAETIIATLDRKYDFVVQSPLETFLLDLKNFIEFINEDELVSTFTSKIVNALNVRGARYKEQLEKEKALAIELKDALIKAHPEIDDSDRVKEGIGDMSYEYSLAAFNRIVSESYRSGTPLEHDRLDDDSDEALLIKILVGKLSQVDEIERKGDPAVDSELRIKVNNLDAAHKFTHLEWINYCRTSPAVEWLTLMEIVRRINPEPKDSGRWQELSIEEIGNAAIREWIEEKPYEWVRDLAYGPITKFADYKPANLSDVGIQKKIEDLKKSLKRVYEAVRQEVGTTGLRLDLLNRYKIRCQWYNHEFLRNSILKSDGEFIRNREDVLTRDLSLYLFDQGVTSIYRPQLGRHEYDLLELDVRQPMFIEAKAYKQSSAKAELVSGVSQLHSYLSSLEAHKDISEAFYVIYRLGGPIYEFPQQISTSRFTIYPIIVDLGLSDESGRNQPKPILLSEEEIMGEVTAVQKD